MFGKLFAIVADATVLPVLFSAKAAEKTKEKGPIPGVSSLNLMVR